MKLGGHSAIGTFGAHRTNGANGTFGAKGAGSTRTLRGRTGTLKYRCGFARAAPHELARACGRALDPGAVRPSHPS